VASLGSKVMPVLNRNYFREPGGVPFEIVLYCWDTA
jgi:hypothetical protein